MSENLNSQDNFAQLPIANLPLVLPVAIKDYLDSLRNKDLYSVLSMRYGLDRRKTHTLEEVGELLGMSRQAIQQKQKLAINKLRQDLLNIPLLELAVNLDLLKEIKSFYNIVVQMGTYVSETDVFQLISKRYSLKSLSSTQKANLYLLFEVFNFEQIEIPACTSFWQVQNTEYKKANLAKISKELTSILHREVKPVSYTDLLLLLKPSKRKKNLTEDIIRFLLSVNTEIEQLDDDYYQISFIELRGAGKLAYRILLEGDETPIHSDTIAREINQRLVSNGRKARGKGTIVNAMGREEHLVRIGKSGLWGLDGWDLVQSTIVQVMLECFHKLNKPARSAEIFDCVTNSRPDAKLTSISTYLSDRAEFVQVGRGLYQPRQWKITSELKAQRKQMREHWSAEKYAEAIVEIYDEQGVTEMPMKELAEELAKISGNKFETIQGNVLSKTPAIKKELIGNGPQKKAILIRDYEFPKRKTLRDEVYQVVRRTLSSHGNKSMYLRVLKDKVMDETACLDKTFYQYLEEMPDVEKSWDETGMKLAKLVPNQASEMVMNKFDYEYDVAISYAGQDIGFAQELNDILRRKGLEPFFAPHEQILLSGEFLPDELLQVYRERSRKCVIFASEHYERSRYTNFERKAAIDRKLDEEDYVILIKLDDTELNWWFRSDVYYDINQTSLEKIADIIVGSLDKNRN